MVLSLLVTASAADWDVVDAGSLSSAWAGATTGDRIRFFANGTVPYLLPAQPLADGVTL